MLHKTSRERYDKLKKVFRRLMQNFNADDLEDFILTVNSMPGWMENDQSLISGAAGRPRTVYSGRESGLANLSPDCGFPKTSQTKAKRACVAGQVGESQTRRT